MDLRDPAAAVNVRRTRHCIVFRGFCKMVPKQAVMNDKNWDEINQPQRAIGSWLRWRWQWRAEVTAGRLDHVLWEMPAKDTGFGNSVLLLLGRPFAFPGRQGAGPRRNYPFLPSQPLGFPQAFDSSFFPLKSPVCLEAPCTWRYKLSPQLLLKNFPSWF